MINSEAEPEVTALLNELGANGVVIEDSAELEKEHTDVYGEIYELNPADYPDHDIRVKCYFNELVFTDQLEQEIQETIANVNGIQSEILSFEKTIIKESDWENEWKNYFHPFKASERFAIVPSWEQEGYQNNEGDLCIKLDPGMAFGTGDHPTTSMCLRHIEEVVQPQHKIIDVGTGSDNYMKIEFEGDESLIGELVKVKVVTPGYPINKGKLVKVVDHATNKDERLVAY
uniref:ETFB lysine methyltransferase n=1 Tax=Acyrthosiphon pisum TaxID=7029 RepID=A0A8R2BAN2_ACYPI|eukprot:XP_008188735.1 PREDICTED: ribosomal protein L11 methyltransferase-like [Acyrthosiphon pisum]